ncbi:MAG: hypothetical protein WBQ52_06165 [Terracidiphilus sp.]
MSVLILIPGCIALFLVLRGRVKRAFLSVYLPSLLLLSQDYSLRLPHFPPLSAAEYALIPIGVVALTRHIRSASFRLMDALVLLFWVSHLTSEILREPVLNDGIFAAAEAFVSLLLAYAVGRQLIEPELRFETVRKWVIFVLLLAPFGLYEWRFGQSVYAIIGKKFLGVPVWVYGEGIQLREGRGRMTVSLGGGELTGIVIAVTFALNAWLVLLNRARTGADRGKWLAGLEKYHVPGLLLLLCIYLTQSRGALISVAAASTILQIPKFKKTKLATTMVAVIFILAALGTKQYFVHYLDVDPSKKMTEEQASAAYRQILNKAYQSTAEKGGWFGWAGAIPVVGGQKSIDNEFLLTHLIQGEFGYILLILIAAESIRTAIARAWSFQALEDRVFACSMIAIFAIFWIAYYTVWMGGQLPQITFLLLGWGQSLVPGKTGGGSVQEVQSRSRFGLKTAAAEQPSFLA